MRYRGVERDQQSSGKLGRRLFFQTFPVVALVVVATLFGLGFLNHQQQLQALTDRAQVQAELTAKAVARPLWNLDRSIYEPQVRALDRDAAFVSVELTDDQQSTVFSHSAEAVKPRDAISVRADVFEPVQNRKVGEIALTLSSAELNRAAGLQAVLGLFAFVTLMLGFFMVARRSAEETVINPLGQLLDAMDKVGRKDWTTVDHNRDDELGSVMTAFNDMVEGLRSGDEAKRLVIQLEEAQSKLAEQNRDLGEANQLIMESIRYASTIQQGLLPDPDSLTGLMDDLVTVWQPLHVVGGDFYWIEQRDDRVVIFLGDCTGHGVPGAFMTLVAAAALDRILREDGLSSASHILMRLDRLVRARLARTDAGPGQDDGLDAALCIWDPELRSLQFAGAGIGLVSRFKDEVSEIKGDRASLGYATHPLIKAIKDHKVKVKPGEEFFLLSDGVTDHVGGDKHRLFGRRRFRELIATLDGRSMADQAQTIEKTLESYRAGEDRRDDLTLIGFRPLHADSDIRKLAAEGPTTETANAG